MSNKLFYIACVFPAILLVSILGVLGYNAVRANQRLAVVEEKTGITKPIVLLDKQNPSIREEFVLPSSGNITIETPQARYGIMPPSGTTFFGERTSYFKLDSGKYILIAVMSPVRITFTPLSR